MKSNVDIGDFRLVSHSNSTSDENPITTDRLHNSLVDISKSVSPQDDLMTDVGVTMNFKS